MDAKFDAVNFTCCWSNTPTANNLLLVLSGDLVRITSPTKGIVAEHSRSGKVSPAISAAAWVNSSTSSSQIAIACGNTVTIRDALTWVVLAEMSEVISADGDEISTCCWLHKIHCVAVACCWLLLLVDI